MFPRLWKVISTGWPCRTCSTGPGTCPVERPGAKAHAGRDLDRAILDRDLEASDRTPDGGRQMGRERHQRTASVRALEAPETVGRGGRAARRPQEGARGERAQTAEEHAPSRRRRQLQGSRSLHCTVQPLWLARSGVHCRPPGTHRRCVCPPVVLCLGCRASFSVNPFENLPPPARPEAAINGLAPSLGWGKSTARPFRRRWRRGLIAGGAERSLRTRWRSGSGPARASVKPSLHRRAGPPAVRRRTTLTA